jgi:hypothetical protein
MTVSSSPSWGLLQILYMEALGTEKPLPLRHRRGGIGSIAPIIIQELSPRLPEWLAKGLQVYLAPRLPVW